MNKQATPKDRWDKLDIVGKVAALIAVPVVIGVVGNWVSISLKERDVQLKTVELAISILNENPKSAPETPELRRWAMTVIDKYSGVSLPSQARQELEKSPLPKLGIPWESVGVATYNCPVTEMEFTAFANDSVRLEESEEGCLILYQGATETNGVKHRCPEERGVLYAPSDYKVTIEERIGKCYMSAVPEGAAVLQYLWGRPITTIDRSN